MASGRPFMPNDDLINNIASLPVGGMVYSTTGRKPKVNSLTNLFTSINTSGPISPSREMPIFTPIHFVSGKKSKIC